MSLTLLGGEEPLIEKGAYHFSPLPIKLTAGHWDYYYPSRVIRIPAGQLYRFVIVIIIMYIVSCIIVLIKLASIELDFKL